MEQTELIILLPGPTGPAVLKALWGSVDGTERRNDTHPQERNVTELKSTFH